MTKRFCTRPSRLFSGNPSALFAPDTQYQSVSGAVTPALASPFTYQFDTPQAPNSRFWHLDKISLLIFNPGNNIAPAPDNIVLLLLPNNRVGSQTQPQGGSIDGVDPNSLGLNIPQLQSDLFNSPGGGGMMQIFYDELPVEVPPGWFLRVAFLDDGTFAPFLPAGTQVTLRFTLQDIPVNFASHL